jgi:hypothetical protein
MRLLSCLEYERSFGARSGSCFVRIPKGDAQALQLAAHSLKSSSVNIGAVQLSSLSNELETRGRERDIKNAEHLLNGIESNYVVIKERLEKEFLAPGHFSHFRPS